jgi:hypothetical protein
LDTRWARRAAFAVALAALAADCRRWKVADPCSAGSESCLDGTTALFCLDEKLSVMPCRGPLGCVRQGVDKVDCDNTIAQEGDGCDLPGDAACIAGHAAELLCKANRFELAATCKGPHGCTPQEDSVVCDNDISEEGDLCIDEGDAACRTDRAAFLKCTSGKFRTTNTCRGPKGCVLSEKPDENKTLFECDDSLAQAGDACEDENDQSCAVDRKALLACHAHKFNLSKACRGPKGCGLNDATGKFDCDARGK